MAEAAGADSEPPGVAELVILEVKMPIMRGVLALQKEASKCPPEKLAFFVDLAAEEEESAMMVDVSRVLDFAKIDLGDLSEDPEEGAQIR